MKKTIEYIAFDADDTLWENELYFQEFEKEFCNLLSPYQMSSSISEDLFKVEMKNLHMYGYGLKSMMLSMIETICKVTEGEGNIGLDIDVSVRCNGVYSYKIVDPLLFYTNVCGNVEQQYDREEIEVQLKTEFVSALQPAFAKISELQIRPSAIPGHVLELCDAMNEALTKKWQQTRGLAVVSIAMNPVTLPEEDAQLIKDAQKNAILRDPTMAAATLAGAQADAMKSAASNTAGAMTGFMGMGMAGQAGGANMQNLYQMGAQQQAAQNMQPASMAGTWKCECGAENTGKFCSECGKPKPQQEEWICSCGAVNTGKFCSECGSPRPAGKWTCSCGAVNTGKFCAECGKPRQ